MATKHFCDICGAEIQPNSLYGLTFEDPMPELFGNDGEHICGCDKNYDLCQVCHFDIVNHMKNRADGYNVYYYMED